MSERRQRAALVAERLWRRCKQDCEHFVRRFVRIEDRDAETLAVPFELWPGQQTSLKVFVEQRLVVALKARQLGFTWLALAYAVWLMVFNPGKSVVALSKKEDPDAKELVRRVTFILRNLPPWMIREKSKVPPGYAGPTWTAGVLAVTIHHPDGEPSTFRSMASAQDSGRSFTASLVILDEWAFQPWAEEIWSSAYPTINRPTGGQVIGISTGKIGTLFEDIVSKARSGENGFHFLFLPWHTDPRRTPEWYEQTKKDLPRSWRREYPATPEDAFSVGEEAFFDVWNPEIHVAFGADWYPPPHWRIIRVYDPGYSSRACCKWYALSPDGWAVCYREYYPTRVTDQEQAAEIVRLSKDRDGASEQIAYTVAGLDAWTPNKQSGISTAEVFARAGISMQRAQTDLVNGWKRLHEWLKPFPGPDEEPMAMLRFTRACRNTIRTYPGLVGSKSNPDTLADGQEDHPQDCDRYFVMSRPAPNISEEERARRERIMAERTRPVSAVTNY